MYTYIVLVECYALMASGRGRASYVFVLHAGSLQASRVPYAIHSLYVGPNRQIYIHVPAVQLGGLAPLANKFVFNRLM